MRREEGREEGRKGGRERETEGEGGRKREGGGREGGEEGGREEGDSTCLHSKTHTIDQEIFIVKNISLVPLTLKI